MCSSTPNTRGDGAKVEDVSPGGPAENAGVRAGDVIVRVNGQEIKGGGLAPGRAAAARSEAGFESEAARASATARSATSKSSRARSRRKRSCIGTIRRRAFPIPAALRIVQLPASVRARELRGLEVTTLTPQLGRYFGTNKGVLVVRAPSR